tara:strand:+ start:21917 stop:24820 length:2904 start_codon:yes stop_codon:yes gene_type:complete
MADSNFSFLSQDYNKLAALGSAAEQYAHDDPQAALVKLRCYTEQLVGYIYTELCFEIEPQADLFARLNNTQFTDVVDAAIVAKFHALRKQGNKAAHSNVEHSSGQTLWLIKEAYFIGRWFMQTMQTSHVVIPEFFEIENSNGIEDALSQKLNKKNIELTQHIETESLALIAAQEELAVLREELILAQEVIVEPPAFIAVEAFKSASKESAQSFDLEMEETRRRVNILDCFGDKTLNEGQKKLVEEVDSFLSDKTTSVFLLKGYAGTGKTFITYGITQYLNAIGRKKVLMAPTGKAAKVLSDKTETNASTIHRIIYNYENVKEFKEEGLEGSETFRCYAELKVNLDTSETVYIIDEASMVSDLYSDSEFFRFGSGFLLKDLLKYINLDHNDHNKKIIFIGDNAQLPPVGMSYSPALTAKYLKDKYQLNNHECELTEVVRQKADSGVMANAKKLRVALAAEQFNQLDFETAYADITPLHVDDLVGQYIEACNGKVAQAKNAIVIASSNRQVSKYNQVIREHFFPMQKTLVAGDKVISVANHYLKNHVVTNGEFGMIKQLLSEPEFKTVVLRKKGELGLTETIQVQLCFRDVELGFRNEYGEVNFFKSKIVENLLYNNEPTLSSDENKALYVDFRKRHPHLLSKSKRVEFKEALLNDPYFNSFKLKFGYAITCHKAQGSEWQQVFLKCSSHHKTLTKDYFRWLYTAITRTSAQLFVIDEPHIKLGSGMKRVASMDFSMPNFELDNPNEISTPSLSHDQTPEYTSEQPVIVTETRKVTDTPSDQSFGIQPNNTPMLFLLAEIKSALIGLGIDVVDIKHNQWQESYLFQCGDDFSTIRFGYNGKYKVSSVLANDESDLCQLILGRVSSFKGILLNTFNKVETKRIIELPEPFLIDFHQRIEEACNNYSVSISEVRARGFAQRYCFQKEGNSAVIDIFYNGKNQFTKFDAKKSLSNSPELINEVERVLEEAFD